MVAVARGEVDDVGLELLIQSKSGGGGMAAVTF